MPLTDARELEGGASLSAQVIVIGTGAGGAAAAQVFVDAGKDVLWLEEGSMATVEQYGRMGTLDATRLLYRDQGLTASQGAPPVMMPMGCCVGGTTMINLGTMLRMLPEHFEHWRAAGLDRITWSDLTRAYDRVEKLFTIEPVPESLIGPNNALLRRGAQRLGHAVEVLARNAPGCKGSGRCFLGCPTDAKQSLHLKVIPDLVARGARLVTRCRVDRIVLAADRVTGVEARIVGARGTPMGSIRARAPRVVIACGALLSPILLLESGIGRDLPAVGVNLGVHPACRAIGVHDTPIQGHRGAPQTVHAAVKHPHEMYLETAFLPPALMAPALPGFGREHHALMREYDHLSLAGFRVIDTRRGSVRTRIGGMPVIRYDLGARDLAAVRAGLAICARLLFDEGARRVHVPIRGMEVLGGTADLDRLDDPRIRAQDLELSGYHAHGTLRMGKDAASTAVDEMGAVRGVRDLYVADASLFPTSSRVNPQLTVMALATLVAEGIAAGL